jgi:hypothetical protein
MFHPPTLEMTRLFIRARVCPHCRFRPAGSERLDAHTPRSCEAQCPIFLHLPQLHLAAVRADPLIGNPRHIIGECIAGLCRARQTPGDAPADDPLRSNRPQVVQALALLTSR